MSDETAVRVAVVEARIDGHEKICADRYGEIKTSFDRVHGRLDWIMRGIIAVLASVVAYMLINGVPWLK